MSRNELVYSLLDYYPTHHSFPMSHIASKWQQTYMNIQKLVYYKSKTYTYYVHEPREGPSNYIHCIDR